MNNDNDILTELKNISPFLAVLPKTTVFTVPDGYFEGLYDNLFYNSTVWFSSNNKSQDRLIAPEGYFNNLSTLILDKIKSENITIEESGGIPLSSELLQAQNNNIFEIPENYFSNIATQIINAVNKDQANIKNGLSTFESVLNTIQSVNIFEVPELYFESLPAAIIEKIKTNINSIATEDILDETLKNARLINVFYVPDGYFKTLPANILSIVNKNTEIFQLPDVLQNLQKINVFDVPDKYFTHLSAGIFNSLPTEIYSTAVDEIEELSPLLHSLQKQNVFEVPAGYFENLSHIKPQEVEPVVAKVIAFPTRKIYARLAAAAIITIALGTGIYNFSTRQTTPVTIAKIAVTTDSAVAKGKTMNSIQFEEALNNLTKEEVINYLEKNNSEEDMPLLTSSLDDNSLPDKDAYLIDSKTLDNYLDQIKSQN